MNLIIVESPTKARTLSRFLGEGYAVEATVGHIKDLPKSKISIDIENNFEPNYEVVKEKEKHIAKIKKSAKKVEKIFLATDPDREGEAIAAHVEEVVGSSRTRRIVFHEITKSAVEKAIGNPRDIDKNLVEAQIARRVLDRLVGYKLSPLLWKKIRRGLSAGRVQTVTVRLIVERERKIEAFKSEEYWEFFCDLETKKKNKFTAKLIKIDEKRFKIDDKKVAGEVEGDLNKAKYEVLDVIQKQLLKNPLPPFTTSTLTQTSARTFFWSAKRTMSIAQKLYEEGLITYHRTDSTHLSKQGLQMARGFIKDSYGEKYLPSQPRIYKTKAKVAQEAHEAIRPTKAEITKEKFELRKGMTNQHLKLYEQIWKRFVASQMSASVYDGTTIDVLAKVSKSYLLRTRGQVMRFDGWRKLFNKTKNGGELPDVKKDELLDLIKVISEQKFTEPSARFGEASLIKTLESMGIGRPSTYAPIISTIQIRNYVEKIEGKFHPTPVGVAVNDFLIKYFPEIFDYSFTAEMEDNLDDIAKGKGKWQKMMGEFYTPFDKVLEKVTEKSKRVKIEAEKLGKKCPECKKGELVIRIGRFGKFVSCSTFPDCKHTEKYINKIGQKCPGCKKGDVIIKTTKRRRKFYGCSRYPDCDWASWRKPTLLKQKPSNDKKAS